MRILGLQEEEQKD